MLVGLPKVMLQVLHGVRVSTQAVSLDSLVENETHIPTPISYLFFERAVIVSRGGAMYADLEGGLNRQPLKVPGLC